MNVWFLKDNWWWPSAVTVQYMASRVVQVLVLWLKWPLENALCIMFYTPEVWWRWGVVAGFHSSSFDASSPTERMPSKRQYKPLSKMTWKRGPLFHCMCDLVTLSGLAAHSRYSHRSTRVTINVAKGHFTIQHTVHFINWVTRDMLSSYWDTSEGNPGVYFTHTRIYTHTTP